MADAKILALLVLLLLGSGLPAARAEEDAQHGMGQPEKLGEVDFPGSCIDEARLLQARAFLAR